MVTAGRRHGTDVPTPGNMYTQHKPQFAPDFGSKLCIHIHRRRYKRYPEMAAAAQVAAAAAKEATSRSGGATTPRTDQPYPNPQWVDGDVDDRPTAGGERIDSRWIGTAAEDLEPEPAARVESPRGLPSSLPGVRLRDDEEEDEWAARKPVPAPAPAPASMGLRDSITGEVLRIAI